MSLINCLECKKEVSNLATSCPSCGAPINISYGRKEKEKELYTIQETSKTLKLHEVCSLIMTIVGIILIFSAAGQVDQTGVWGVLIGCLMALGGAFWFLITRMRVWWNHK